MKKKRILLIEDDSLVRESIKRDFKKVIKDECLGPFKCNIRWTDSVDKALKMYNKDYYDLIILDLRLSTGSGIEFLENIRENDKTTPILVLSAFAEHKDMHEIGKYSNNYFFHKSFTETGTGNPRRDQFIKCLREGEENFLKIHRDIYIPPMLAIRFFKSKLYGNVTSDNTRKEWLKYYRNPQSGFEGKGILDLLDQIGQTVSGNIETVNSKLFANPVQVGLKEIIERLRGVYSLENMEQFLSSEPNYREHFVHQFQNFLIGCAIYGEFKPLINPYIKEIFKKSSGKTIPDEDTVTSLFEISWYLTALFHDYGYPVQYFEKVISRYFKENFCYRFPPAQLSMENLIIHEGLDYYFNSITEDFCPGYLRERKEEFKMLLVHQFKEKNHAIHSSIALRKLMRYHEDGEVVSQLFTPVYTAIALHDWGLWSNAVPVEKFLSDNKNKIKHKFEFQYKLNFLAELEKNPLLHLLILVDTIQCWGRPVGGESFIGTSRLELVDIRDEVEGAIDFLTFELNVREGTRENTSKEVFCDYCRTFKTLSVILGSGGLPVKVVLNQGLIPSKTLTFQLGGGKTIDCNVTTNCPK